MDEIQKLFEVEGPVFPFEMRQDGLGYFVTDTETAFKCFQAGYIAGQKSKDATLEAGQRFRAAYEAVDQDQNEETEGALLDAIANYDKVTK